MNYKRSAKDIAAELGSDIEKGLSIGRAHERIHSRGRNTIRLPKKMNAFTSAGRHLFSLMNIILLVLAAVYLFTGVAEDWYLSAFFALCALTNAAVGYISFRRDSAPLRMLSAAQNEEIRVIRSGAENRIPAMLLAQGDVFILESGQTVPADAKIIECKNAVVDETVLSGDGGSVVKSAGNGFADDENETVIYMGTRVINGTVKAIVTATGSATQLGSTVGLMSVKDDKASSLAKKNVSIGNIFGSVAIAVWFVALLLRLISGHSLSSAFDNALSAAAAVLPLTMPPLVLLTMNFNVIRLRRHGIEPRSASVVETMGAASMLCVGKRGTLTQQSFEVAEIRPGRDFDENQLRLLAAMCTTADLSGDRPVGDPMQVALIEDAVKNGCTMTAIRESMPTEMVIDSHRENRLMTTVHKTERGHIIICKGAPDAVAACCGKIYDGGPRHFDVSKDLPTVMAESNRMAAGAMSVMAVAYKETVYAPEPEEAPIEKDMVFAGLIGLSTAIRKDTPAAVKQLKNMGVKTCIITNESLTTALAVAGQSGISRDNAVQGANVDINDVQRLRRISVFADVGAKQKADIVAALNAEKENVVVVGRGVRDVSAMNNADVSLTTDAGARICAAAADINVSGAGLGRIAEAVRECKRAFLNTERMIGFLLTCSIAQAVCAVGTLAMGYSAPFSPLGVIWIELALSAIAAIGIWCEPYHRSPVKRTELNTMKSGRLSPSVLRMSLVRGILTGLSALLVYRSLVGRVDTSQRRGAVVLILLIGFTFMGQCWRSADIAAKCFVSNLRSVACFALNILVCILTLSLRPVMDLLSIERPDGGSMALCVLAGIVPALIAEAVKLIGFGGNKSPARREKAKTNKGE